MEPRKHVLLISKPWAIIINKTLLILTLIGAQCYFLSKLPWMMEHNQTKMFYLLMGLIIITSCCIVACLYNELFFAILVFNVFLCTQLCIPFLSNHTEVIEPFFKYTAAYLFIFFLGLQSIYSKTINIHKLKPQRVAYNMLRTFLVTAFLFCIWAAIPEQDFLFLITSV